VDVGGLAGSAHGDVLELAAAAIGVEVGGVEGRPLASMNGGGVPVGKLVGADLVGPQGVGATVVGPHGEAAGFGAQGAGRLAGDGGAHDPVAGVLERLAGGVRAVLFPGPATPTINSTGRPEVTTDRITAFCDSGEHPAAQLIFLGPDRLLRGLGVDRGRAGAIDLNSSRGCSSLAKRLSIRPPT
jgi:hypothetical protein